jgi:hypothetical protein
MKSEQRSIAVPEPITIDLDANHLIQRVDRNITQEIFVTTVDKARLCLIEALGRMERRDAWIAPTGILVTLAVVLLTTTFQDFLTLSKEYWKAMFSFATVVALVWLVYCLCRRQNSLTVEQIVDQLRTNSLPPAQQPEWQVPGDLVILKALYGVDKKRINVTDQLNGAIGATALHMRVGNELGGDPCPNSAKDLIVTYRYKNQEHQITVMEGADLNLP